MFRTSTDGIVPCTPPDGFPTVQFGIAIMNETSKVVVIKMEPLATDPSRLTGVMEGIKILEPGQVFNAAATAVSRPLLTLHFHGSTTETKMVIMWDSIQGIHFRTVSTTLPQQLAPSFRPVSTRVIDLEWSNNVKGLPYLSLVAGGYVTETGSLPPPAPLSATGDEIQFSRYETCISRCGQQQDCVVGEPAN